MPNIKYNSFIQKKKARPRRSQLRINKIILENQLRKSLEEIVHVQKDNLPVAVINSKFYLYLIQNYLCLN
jgi:hypothetical protein